MDEKYCPKCGEKLAIIEPSTTFGDDIFYCREEGYFFELQRQGDACSDGDILVMTGFIPNDDF